MTEVPFKVVQCYHYDFYDGWTTKVRPGEIPIESAYFWLIGDNYYLIGDVGAAGGFYMGHE